MDRAPIELSSFHHVYNRGVDKRKVFMDDKDRNLFLRYLLVLNDQEIESPRRAESLFDENFSAASKRLVDIVCFCLMDNHFHLLLHECFEGGISKFMQRLGTAYTMYFNEKYERGGSLFQGRFKSKVIDDERYLMTVIDYIHCNPVKRSSNEVEKFRDYRLKNTNDDLQRLDKYKWSSYGAFCGKREYGNIINPEVLKDYLYMPKDYRKWLKEEHDLENGRAYLID